MKVRTLLFLSFFACNEDSSSSNVATQTEVKAETLPNETQQPVVEMNSNVDPKAAISDFHSTLRSIRGNQLTEEEHASFCSTLDDLRASGEDVDKLIKTTLQITEYQKLFWNDISLSFESKTEQNSPERIELEKSLLSDSAISLPTITRNQEMLQKITKGEPIERGTESFTFDKAKIKETLDRVIIDMESTVSLFDCESKQ
jgi:hypothetical protein